VTKGKPRHPDRALEPGPNIECPGSRIHLGMIGDEGALDPHQNETRTAWSERFRRAACGHCPLAHGRRLGSSPDVDSRVTPNGNWDRATSLPLVLSVTIVSAMTPWFVVPAWVVSGVVALGCSATPSATPRLGPGSLAAHVTSVTATLEPYNPQISNHGIPAEQVNFTVSGLPTPSEHLYLHCNIAVFHSGRQVGATSMVATAVASQSVSVEVNGDSFDGIPSDAHVVCVANPNPIGT